MQSVRQFTGITGVLRPYREFIQETGPTPGAQIVYYGCAGTCTPFIELLAVSLRGLGFEQVFVPLLDETKAKIIHEIPDVGMQISGLPVVLKPRFLVFMGGLAMPHMPVTKDDAQIIIRKHGDVIVIGVCFMSMFEKAGWQETVKFDLLIDGTLDPVTVTCK